MTKYVRTSERSKVFTQTETDLIKSVKDRVLSLTDGFLSNSPRDKYVIAGGVFVSFLNNEKYNDIDCFILDSANQSNQYAKTLMETLEKDKKLKMKYRNSYGSVSKVVASTHDTITKINYIFTEYKTRADLIENFDYVHCCISLHNSVLYCSRLTFDCIIHKVLLQNSSNTPEQYRTDKFLGLGWTPQVKSQT